MKVKVKVMFNYDVFFLVHIYYKVEGKLIYTHIYGFPEKFFTDVTLGRIYKGEFNIDMIKKEVEDYLREVIKVKEEEKIRNKNLKDFAKQEIKFEFDIEEKNNE